MDIKKITMLVIFIAVLGIAAYDVYAIAMGGTEASISHTIMVWSYKYPAMTFATGFLCGHLFWRTLDTKKSNKIAANVREKDQE